MRERGGKRRRRGREEDGGGVHLTDRHHITSH
jgi:hypothetical protein